MQSAPSVTYPVGRSRFHACVSGAVVLAGGGVAVAWHCQADQFDWRQGLMLALWLLSSSLLWAAWWRGPAGSLRWDGQSWWWETAGGMSGTLAIHLDGQHVLLASLQPHGAEARVWLWLWLDRSSEPSRWNALRRAVYSSSGPALSGAASLPVTRREAGP